MNIAAKNLRHVFLKTELQRKCFRRSISSSKTLSGELSYKLVIVGGGSGGCAMAAKFATHFDIGKVAVIEPSLYHYYQPLWTLVGGGIKKLPESKKTIESCLPKRVVLLNDEVAEFLPKKNAVLTKKGDTISYDHLIVAMGLQTNYSKIKGLPEAFKTPGVCSNYSPLYVEKTFEEIHKFKQGNAIFTYPNTPVKCPGAPQKIMYLAEDYFKKRNVRGRANVMYNTALGVIFGVKKYADRLMAIVDDRAIKVNFKHDLIEVKPDKKEAVFQILETANTTTFDYELLHVTPPMGPPDVIKNSPLSDSTGFLNVNKDTLQHMLYPNIFGIGDCTNLPTSKTVAAISGQSGVLKRNLISLMKGKPLDAVYDGYSSCPLITAYGRCILAEFDYNLQPLETFPFDQGKERWLMYILKKDVIPFVYWEAFLKGEWDGPRFFRKLFHFGVSK